MTTVIYIQPYYSAQVDSAFYPLWGTKMSTSFCLSDNDGDGGHRQQQCKQLDSVPNSVKLNTGLGAVGAIITFIK